MKVGRSQGSQELGNGVLFTTLFSLAMEFPLYVYFIQVLNIPVTAGRSFLPERFGHAGSAAGTNLRTPKEMQFPFQVCAR